MPITHGRRLMLELPSTASIPAVGAALEAVSPPQADAPAWAAASAPGGASEHPWDQAHRAVRDPAAIGLEAVAPPTYAEPDLVQTFPFPRPDSGGLEWFTSSPCEERAPDDYWPVGAPAFGWHL